MEKHFIMMKFAEALKSYFCKKKRITDPLKNTLQYLKKYCEVNENHAENSIKNVQKPF